jgi:integrase
LPRANHVPRLCVRRDGRAYATDPATRKPVYFGRAGSPAAQATYAGWVAALAARRQQVASGQPPGTVPTVARLVIDYLAFAEGYYRKRGRPTSEVTSIRTALDHPLELYGALPADRFGPAELKASRQRMVAGWEDDGRRHGGWARGHVNDQVARIRRCWKWAVEHDLVPAAVLAGLQAVAPLKRGRTSAPEEKPVQAVEMGVFFDTLPWLPSRLATMAILHLHLGCRADEVRQLRGRDLDRSQEPWLFTPDSHKTEHHDRPCKIWIGPAARRTLDGLLVDRPDDWLFPGRGRGPRARYSGPVTVSGYRQAVGDACAAAGLPHWSPLMVRHLALTLARSRYGLDAAQQIAGHSSADVTQLYAEADEDLARRAAEEGWL